MRNFSEELQQVSLCMVANPYELERKGFFDQLHISNGINQLIISAEFPESILALEKYWNIMSSFYPDENAGIYEVFNKLTAKEWMLVRAYYEVNSHNTEL